MDGIGFAALALLDGLVLHQVVARCSQVEQRRLQADRPKVGVGWLHLAHGHVSLWPCMNFWMAAWALIRASRSDSAPAQVGWKPALTAPMREL